MSPTPMHQSSGSSAQPSSKVLLDRRQEQGLAAYFPSYFLSQWEICSISTDWFSEEIAFSTGMTCIPIPAPPCGTIGVTFSSGSRDMRSKKRPSSGCSSSCFWFMLVNSALPGTNIGRTYCFSCFGFSQLYSKRPATLIS
ncbi:unknown [Roseburia sp. CAG:182]|nr:unknown [Roseburia sp. CAG:182]